MTTTSTPAPARWISIEATAAHLSVSTKTVRRLISRGDLPARRFGARIIRVDADQLDSFGYVLAARS